MNRTYKVIWSKARHCYVVVSELTKSQHKSSSKSELINTNIHREGNFGKAAVAAIVAGLLTFGGVAYSPVLAADNTAGSGDGVAVGTGSSAPKAENVAIGKRATISYSGGVGQPSTGDIVIGGGAHINNYIDQGGGIAIGANSFVENMTGGLERSFDFKQAGYNSFLGIPYGLPKDPTKMVTGVAVGQNTYARSGSIMLGTHNYKGDLGDVTVDSANTKAQNMSLFSTTLGANSYSNGLFSSVTGAYSIASSNYSGGENASKNFGATITGSLNSIESATSDNSYSGIANSIVGTANRASNSNGSLIFGAGNEIKNSITNISAPSSGGDSAQALQNTLMKAVQDSESGGATLAIGGGNKANYTQKTSIIGVNNKVVGEKSSISSYNSINGFKNTVTNASHVKVLGQGVTINKGADSNTVIGDYRTVAEGQTHNVIIGNADEKTPITTEKKDTVILGHNANAKVDGGVAIGAGSVASREAGEAGYDPATKEASKDISATWKATDAAVSVGKSDGTMTRQITGVAAGSAATDAVNVAQLQKALAGAKDGNDTLKSDTNALKLDGNTLSMNVEDTAGHKVSGSVDLSKFAQAVDTNTTYTLTGQANQDNTTTITLEDNNGKKNSVTVATKDTRNTVKAGENVTLDTKNNADGSHEYTVHVKADGKVEAGSTKIVSGGTVYNETRVAKDGNFVKQSNTAGENLSALDNQVTANTESIYHMNGRISDLDNRVNKVGAGAAALAALHPLDFDPEDKWDFAVGYGNYRNANSVALGAFYRPNEDTMFSLGTNFGNGENMFNAGLSFKIGQGSGITTSKTAMAKKIESLENTVDQQDKKIAELEALVKEQGEMIRQYVGKK